MKIGIIGGGVMGLTAAYELAKQGESVVIFEKQDNLGGLAGSFEWQGIPIEKYYHFICLPDRVYIEFLKELGLGSRLRWRSTRMAYFYNGQLYPWGDPLSLLLFPGLTLLQKIRYAVNVLYSKYFSDWKEIEDVSAEDWLKGWLGEEAFEILWKTLLELKFGGEAGQVSAAWIWSRIRRVANSRKGLFQETYGYLEGGSESFIRTLAERIRQFGGKIEISAPILEIMAKDSKVIGARTNQKEYEFDTIISTIPLPQFLKIIANLPRSYRERLSRIKNIGITCARLLLKRPLTNNFWLNIRDPRINLPGIIEYTNLNPSFKDRSLIYIPQYISSLEPQFSLSDQELLNQYFPWLKIIKPDLKDNDLIDFKVFRDQFAQPIPQKGFSKGLPPIQSPIDGLYVADTSYYFPEDRTIDQSITLGKKIAQMVNF